MAINIVSDCNSWAAFFTEITKYLNTNVDSFAKSPMNIGVKLANIATTPGRGNKKFPYFKAVDTGRSAVYPTGSRKSIRFSAGGQTFVRRGAGAFSGHNITVKSLTKIRSVFPQMVIEAFRAWLDNNIKVTSVGNSATGKAASKFSAARVKLKRRRLVDVTEKVGRKSVTTKKVRTVVDDVPVILDAASLGSLSDTQLARIDAAGATTAKTIQRQISADIRGGSSVKEALSRAKAAQAAAREKETQRQLLITANRVSRSSGRSLSNLNKPGFEAANSEFFNAMLRIPNRKSLASIFIGIITEQVEIFKANTPARKDIKLSQNGEEISPQEELKNSYVLVADKGLAELVK